MRKGTLPNIDKGNTFSFYGKFVLATLLSDSTSICGSLRVPDMEQHVAPNRSVYNTVPQERKIARQPICRERTFSKHQGNNRNPLCDKTEDNTHHQLPRI